ncbi:FadR family transcriptional regulator [Alicyclobacillus tolerans]|uniref:FadR/GntR family transcriptional regulator n=1 Tax=Alicyclobacillus tolerans TaxID=90970 RepID=UPI001F2533CC|nr:FadR/GntR family transcriptional regulator [Alicyclobacillus tolerans]MCF8566547.1 FadR family transcriptional regulator [Alicyclobacillus tolerans]
MQLTKKVYEFVADELRRSIESNLLKPGDKLATIEQLAKQFRVGRSTIREALGLLKAQGLVESVQGGGTYVLGSPVESFSTASSQWLSTHAELKQLLQVRKILEIGSISLAAVQRTQRDITELNHIVEQMRQSVADEEVSQLHDVNFHLSIARASQNPLLVNIMESLSSAMTRTMRDSRKLWLYRQWDSAAQLFHEHEQMFHAIVQQDESLASDIMKSHLDRVERAFEQTTQSH